MWINNHLAWNLLTNTCIRIRIHTRNHKTNIEIFFLFLFTDYFKAIRLNGVARLHFFCEMGTRLHFYSFHNDAEYMI